MILLFSPAPSLAPDSITACATSPTSLAVKWSHLAEEKFHGKQIGYNISYYSVKLEKNINFVTVNYTKTTTTLINLTVYTVYVINVSAVSSGGTGPSKTVKARTGAEGKVWELVKKKPSRIKNHETALNRNFTPFGNP